MSARLACGVLAGLALCFGGPARADSWRYPAKMESTETRFGDTRIVQIVDARKNTAFPDFTVEFWRGKTLLARYPGMGFDQVFASPGHDVFVGLSNDGIPGSAAAVFGPRGDLRLEARHDQASFDYCVASVTRVREWYDGKNPGVEFTTSADPGGTDVTLRDCRGQRIHLASAVMDAHRRAAERQQAAPWTCQTASTAQARRQQVETSLLPRVAFSGETAPADIAARMAVHKVPAFSVAVIRDGQLDWTAAWGHTDAGGVAAGCDTLFQAGSLSKPATVLAALRLQQAGRIDLDADVSRSLSSWPLPPAPEGVTAPITWRHLFAHTSGLTPGGYDGYARGQPLPTDVQTVSGESPANVEKLEWLEAPGTSLRYSGGGYTVAEIALQDELQAPFESLMREWLLAPVGMKQADFTVPLPASRAARAARGHQADGRPVEGGWHHHPEQAAAGLWATPSDLALLLIELRKGWLGQSEVFTQESIRELMAAPFDGHAYGFRLIGEGNEVFITHYGGTVGYRAGMTLNLETGNGAVYLSNADSGSALGQEFFTAVSGAYGWPAFRQDAVQRTAQPEPVLKALVGRYQFPDGPAVGVAFEQGQLTLLFPNGDRYPLVPIAGAPRAFIHADTGVRASFDGQGDKTVIHLYGETAPRIPAAK
ncbi:MAG: serine hydrolase [Arenimonas sp.]|nr:serine hydrolase [Arenimonas sp.]